MDRSGDTDGRGGDCGDAIAAAILAACVIGAAVCLSGLAATIWGW
jgi:hypothetical protein